MLDSPALTAVFNFRDLASAAPQLRAGVLYRSDGLHRTDRAGGDALARLGIRQVIDLRSLDEGEREGRFAHPDIETVPLPVFERSSTLRGQLDQTSDDPLFQHYLAMLDENAESIARVLRAIAAAIGSERSLAFHCTAGKDRTGIVAMLVLGLAGVDDESIVADYVRSDATTIAMSRWYESERNESQAQKALEMGLDPNAMQLMMRSRPETMRSTLAAVRERHGSIADYVATIGIDASDRDVIASLGRS